MLGNAQFRERSFADKLRVKTDFCLCLFYDFFGNQLRQLIDVVTAKLQLPASALISFHHYADLVGIKRRICE
jgi:hypothetical protein